MDGLQLEMTYLGQSRAGVEQDLQIKTSRLRKKLEQLKAEHANESLTLRANHRNHVAIMVKEQEDDLDLVQAKMEQLKNELVDALFKQKEEHNTQIATTEQASGDEAAHLRAIIQQLKDEHADAIFKLKKTI